MTTEFDEVATLRAERDRLKAALSNHLCEHDMADWVRCGGGHGPDLACDVCAQAEGGLHRHELVTQIEALWARVQHLTEALETARGYLVVALRNGEDGAIKAALRVLGPTCPRCGMPSVQADAYCDACRHIITKDARPALTPPASTEGSNG
jgi:hypothetical protein